VLQVSCVVVVDWLLKSSKAGLRIGRLFPFRDWVFYYALVYPEGIVFSWRNNCFEMAASQLSRVLAALLFAFILIVTFNARAGGSGLNTIVVANQASSNSCLLANYYCERRSIPPENLLKIYWGGGNVSWTDSEFVTNLLNPLLESLKNRQLTNQIDYVVLSMDIPYRTIFPNTNINSTTSALFYGQGAGGADAGTTNSYAFSESTFQKSKPVSFPTNSFLATMITSDSLSNAKKLVDRGVESDGSFPGQPVVLAKSSDTARNIRHRAFDNAIFNSDLLAVSTVIRTNQDSPSSQSGLLGYQTGLPYFSISSNTFVPGAIADSFTSFGGIIFGNNDQTNLLAFINAGASGSYGTVAEPGTDTQKFPDPQVYFYQARGFNIAESYYQSVNAPYLGLTVAEPLASPFARLGSGSWSAGVSNAFLAGTAPLSVHVNAHDATRPIQQIDLFIDGKFYSTITNISPAGGNKITLSLNGYPISYTVTSNLALQSIVNDVASLINTASNFNLTKIKAIPRGDRIELQSTATNHQAFPFFVSEEASATITGATYRVSYLPETFKPRLYATGADRSGKFEMNVEIPTALNYAIQASTNLVDWTSIMTNSTPGLLSFTDPESLQYPKRFYRVAGPTPYLPPKVSVPTVTNGGTFSMMVESQPGQPCTVLYSANQIDWIPVITNQSGGAFEFLDATASTVSRRFYRAWITPPTMPAFSVVATNPSSLLRVDSAVQPYTVDISTNGTDWVSLATNFTYRQISMAANSTTGNASYLTTFVRASCSTFLPTSACGYQEFKLSKVSPLAAGDYLRFAIAKTNGQSVIIAATNQTAGVHYTNLVAEIVSMINTNPLLQSEDGVIAEDFSAGNFSSFFLRARSSGHAASGVYVNVTKKGSGLTALPSSGTLRVNLADLQPRNHLYVAAGAGQINANFTLDTITLPDGYHELTAVAYEGSSVRTQTRTTVPVRVQNTSLTATMTLLGLTNNASAQGSYQIQIAASTNNISSIKLFTTGGAMAVATNVSNVIFPVHGTNLWAGLHPFYALVEAAAGQKYRTRTEWIRMSP